MLCKTRSTGSCRECVNWVLTGLLGDDNHGLLLLLVVFSFRSFQINLYTMNEALSRTMQRWIAQSSQGRLARCTAS